MQHHFDHENLDAYRVAREVHQWLAGQSFPSEFRHLRNQALRASSSVVLNIAEGAALRGKSRQHHLRIALGPAAETCAVLDCVPFANGQAQQHKLRRVGAMLIKLAR